MELEEKQYVLKTGCLLVREYTPKLGYEVLPGGDENLLLYLSREDIEKTARDIFHIHDIPYMCKLLNEGESFIMSEEGIEIVKSQPIKAGLDMSFDSCWGLYKGTK